MPFVVADHVHDETLGIYLLVIGEVVEHEEPVLNEDGSPQVDENGRPVTQTVSEIVPISDVAFAADDPAYEDKTPAEIATIQRAAVTEALTATQSVAASADVSTSLPGIGESLEAQA
jgi:hypothetical protein